MTRVLALLAACGAGLVGLVSEAAGQSPPIYSPAHYKVPSNPRDLGCSDLNNDGALDLVVVSNAIVGLQWFDGDGAGSFSSAGNIAAGGFWLALGDVNGDGFEDAVIARVNAGIMVLLGNAAGQFATPTSIPLGMDVRSVALGDWDLDGKVDTIACDQLPMTLWLLRGNGLGGFTTAASAVMPVQPVQVQLEDVDGDGILDAAVATQANPMLLFLGTGASAFGAPYSVNPNILPRTFALGDLNNDGKPDLATGNMTLQFGVSTASVSMNAGGGAFFGPSSHGIGFNPNRVAIRDLDLDSRPDVVIATADDRGLYVLLGDGAGTVGSPVPYLSGPNTTSLAVGDWNGDARLDAATTSYPAGLSTFVGDGNGAFAAPIALPTAWNLKQVAAGDWNVDGYPDLLAASAEGKNISSFLGNSLGAFETLPKIPTGADPREAIPRDVNGDGDPDLLVLNRAVGDVWLFLGNNLGRFGNGAGVSSPAAVFSFGAIKAEALVVGDLTGDGNDDFLVTSQSSATAAVMTNNGSGGFAFTNIVSLGAQMDFARLGDLDNDGKLDLVAAEELSYAAYASLGNGSGGFGPAVVNWLPSRVVRLNLGDVHNDGKLDLAVAFYESPQGVDPPGVIGLMSGNGSATFSAAVQWLVYQFPYAIAVVDVDASGFADLVVATSTSGGVVTVLLNDGTGNFPISRHFACGVGGSSLAALDMNLDGIPDPAMGGASGEIDLILSTHATVPGVFHFGGGAAGCFGAHLFTCAGTPRVGATAPLVCDHGAPLSLGLGLLADAKSAAGVDPFLVGIPLYVDPLASGLFVGFDLPANASGNAAVALPIPNVPQLVGSHFFLQAIWLTGGAGCLPSPFGLSASNGLELVIQP